MNQSENYIDINTFFDHFESDFTVKCNDCGQLITAGEGYYEKDGKPYCEECIESADLEDLLRICETETFEVYRALGLQHQYAGE